jgi:EspG family
MQSLHNKRAAVRKVDLHPVGSIELTDLDIISRSYGRDFLPYPFMLTRPSPFSSGDDYAAYATTVPDRFNNGDLRTFRRWAATYAYADIRVECHVQYIPADTPSVRVVANRAGELGYLAKQRPDEDIVDVYETSPYDLGLAIAESAGLVKPGDRPEIVIPEYVAATAGSDDADDFTLREIADETSATEVRRVDVTAFGTVQSHWRPTRRWGFDSGKNGAVWVRIKDDGDYLYAADFSVARPVTQPALAERIDELIAADVVVLRDFRNG